MKYETEEKLIIDKLRDFDLPPLVSTLFCSLNISLDEFIEVMKSLTTRGVVVEHNRRIILVNSGSDRVKEMLDTYEQIG